MVLIVLGEGVAISNAALARRTFVTSQSAHQVVVEMTRRGLVQRGPHPTNRRIKVAELTDAGWELLERCRPEVIETEQRLLASLPAAQRRMLMPALLTSADVLAGGWFGDVDAEAAAASLRADRGGQS